MAEIKVELKQTSDSATQATMRTHQVMVDRPEPKGGKDEGAMGGELFLAGLGGCFMSNLLAAIKSREADIRNVNLTMSGTLVENPMRFSAVHLHVTAEHQDKEQLDKLIVIAERGCIVANTVKDSVDLTFSSE